MSYPSPATRLKVEEAFTALTVEAVKLAERHVKRQLRDVIRRRVRNRVLGDALVEALS